MNIEEVDLDLTIPDGRIRMVQMQPFVHFPPNATEPFCWSTQYVNGQLSAIRRTMEIARGNENREHATFTIFPEYSIPGLKGVETIEAEVGDGSWPKGTIVIAGVDGLQKDAYRTLCDGPDTVIDDLNSPDRVNAAEWVNCCVTWAKSTNGDVKRWVQPKMRPAGLEQNVVCESMYRGKGTFVFKAPLERKEYSCRFLTVICYDWVSRESGTFLWKRLFQAYGNERSETTPLTWLFVIQQNDKPNHHLFLDNTRDCFDRSVHAQVDLTHAGIVLANNAATASPSRSGKGGFSAVVYNRASQFDCNGCRPSVCTMSDRRRGLGTLHDFKDAVFRENGACIHSFYVRIPCFVAGTADDRHPPVDQAETYSLDGQWNARLPDGPVAAITKWVHDELDCSVSHQMGLS